MYADSMQKFINLRARTEFSITESTFRLDEAISLAHQANQGAVAITDVDSMFGALRFYAAAKSAGIKPIIGVDLSIQASDEQEARIVLIAKNFKGYLRLLSIISEAHVRPKTESSHALLTQQWLNSTEQETELFCLAGAHEGFGKLLTCNESLATEFFHKLSRKFPKSLFLEIQRPGFENDNEIITKTSEFSEKWQAKLCVTHPVQFAKKEDFVAHELRVCDKKGYILHDRNRPRPYTPHQHFISPDEAMQLFSDFPEAISNSVAIAESCNIEIPLGKSVLPNFDTDGEPIDQALKKLSENGLAKRMLKSKATDQSPYQARLEMELQVIHSMGFDGYFLIVQDFISWAKTNNIPVGPGRGSGAGSLVAYSLGITDLDPLQYNLLFERFLNPERVSMPDFDIDFCKSKRELVVEYVAKKYGRNSVSGIANINTLQAKAAIKAAGRALGMRVPFVDSVSKLIPVAPGKEISISSSLAEVEILKNRVEQEPEVQKLITMAQALEGLPTAIGQHAAGLVISPTVISDYAPLYKPEGKTQPVTQYDKDDVEKAGLVKFDFLGLKTLTEIQFAVDLIRKKIGHEQFNIEDITLDDPNVFQVFQNGDTHCIFQFESSGMQRLLKEAHPETFGDLVALNALYRPGPMDLIPEFIKRKSGEQKVLYLDDRLEPILSETYGIMVYQEQVMQIAQVIGGYSLGGADLLRRAMGKKKPEEMAKHRKIFIDGAETKGVTAESAGILYDMMEKFAGYGFNKSHAAAYTLLAYQTAYIKNYHPECFYAAWLSIESEEDTATIPALIKDARKHDIQISAPCINKSFVNFSIDYETHSLIYGLSGLKGLGIECAKALIENREKFGPFKSLLDSTTRLAQNANKKVLETLTKSGAFDAIHSNRKETLIAIPLALTSRKELSKYKEKVAIFEESDSPKKKKPLPPTPFYWPDAPPQSLLELLAGERDAFGFYFSKHPYEYYANELDGIKSCETLTAIAERPIDWDQHMIAGVVSEMRLIDTKSGKFFIASIGDGDTEIEVKAFSSVAKKITEWIKKDSFVVFVVNLREDRLRGGKSIQVTDAIDFDAAKLMLCESLNMFIDLAQIQNISKITNQFPGSFPLYLWHAGESDQLIRSRSPYAYIDKSQICFDSLDAAFPGLCMKSYLQGRPSALNNK